MSKKSLKPQKDAERFTYQEALGYALALLARVEQGEVEADQIRTALASAPLAVKKKPRAVNAKLIHFYDIVCQLRDGDQERLEQLIKDRLLGKEATLH